MPALSARRLDACSMARVRWLVIAPHADDETLGCGALIAQAASRNTLAGVVVLTNGAGSHSHDDQASRARLIAARRHEASLAVRHLAGSQAPQPVFLDWPDARPFTPGSPDFERTRRTLVGFCRRHRVDAIAVTARHEPHCDHEAALELARAVAQTARRPVSIVEYIVWASTPPGAGYRTIRTAPMPLGQRNRALAAHRSQITPLFGEGFRLSAEKLRMPAFDLLYQRIGRYARAD